MLAPEAVRGKLNAYLKSRFPSMPEPVILSLEWVPGGRSKFTALLEIAEAVGFGRRWGLGIDEVGNGRGGEMRACRSQWRGSILKNSQSA
jgi:hypothetical protein